MQTEIIKILEERLADLTFPTVNGRYGCSDTEEVARVMHLRACLINDANKFTGGAGRYE